MKLHRNEKYVKWGLTAFAVVVASVIFWLIFSNLRGFYNIVQEFVGIISPLIYGALFAYLMNPVMKRTQKLMDKVLGKRKLKPERAKSISKITGIVVALLVLLLAIFAICALIVPSLVASLETLLSQERLDRYYNTISKWINGFLAGTDVQVWVKENLGDMLNIVLDALKKVDISALVDGLFSSVYSVFLTGFNLLIGIVAAVYFLVFKESLQAQSKKVVVAFFRADHADRLLEVARRANRIFGNYLIGKIIDAIIVGVITYIGMEIMGMAYAPLIATIIGVTNIIPFFGPFIGLVPSALILLIDNPLHALYFVIFILVLQAIDGNIIENRILGEKLGISDLWVLAAILVFGGIFGFAGMLLGVPIFAVIYSLIVDRVNKRLKRKRYPIDTGEYYSIRCVDDLPAEPPPSYSFDSVEPTYDLEMSPDDDYEIEDLDYE